MADQTTNKQAHSLLSYYELLYRKQYGKKPNLNRFREKWAMVDVIDSVGYDRARELFDYYFKITDSSHSLQWFCYNFDKLDTAQVEQTEDKKRRQKILAETKKRVEEWSREHGSTSNFSRLPE